MSLLKKIESIQKEFKAELSSATKDSSKISDLYNKYLSRKGIVSDLFSQLSNVDPKDKPIVGQKINALRNDFEASFDKLGTAKLSNKNISNLDFSLPGNHFFEGSIHPITRVINDISDIFKSIGFSVTSGNEIEDDFYNFEALNIPKHHPARDMQDTYYLNNEKLLRTHTSASQIHFMEENEPPIKIISPGRVYRNEDISVRSYCLFHQIEGLYVDKKVSFSDLKGVMEFFSKKYFGENVKVRFRPSYFPFTEPSAEMDIYWGLESESDYRITKGTGWLEILGCGMVDPEVFKSVKYDSSLKGYAFGIGIERIAMLKYGITDIRLLYEGDIRFLRQF
ncbi:MAG: phenylalanine--tRNA ligase subunit alpha [bacterium TMED6]|nr:MAG: phenylalanine--tRNA ligase subunit alpha [bacterium TMED6]